MSLTDEEIAREQEFMKGLPRVNIGALFMPPIWGAGHGFWVTLIWYPLWLIADNCFYAAYAERTLMSMVLAVFVFITLTIGTFAFAIVSQPLAAHRAEAKGTDRETYLRREKKWAVASVILGIIMIIGATYFNLVLRASMGGL